MTNVCTSNSPESTSQESSQGVPLDQLGAEIAAHIEAGDKSTKIAEDRFRAAGLLLIEARKVVPVKGLEAFLRDHCAGLSLTRAKELIAIAEGRTTQEDVRRKATARKQKSRAAKAKGGRDSHGQSGGGYKAGTPEWLNSQVDTFLSALAQIADTRLVAMAKKRIAEWQPAPAAKAPVGPITLNGQKINVADLGDAAQRQLAQSGNDVDACTSANAMRTTFKEMEAAA